MSIDKIRSSYKNLVNKWSDPPQEEVSAEDKLDALLSVQRAREDSGKDTSPPPVRASALDVFRARLQDELIPVFEDLKRKYADQSCELALEASEFLDGGRKLAIEFTVQDHTVRLEGTVMDNGIAFNEIRSIGGVPGAICSGPMLRTRQLTAEQFREFVCGRIAMLVRSILRQKR